MSGINERVLRNNKGVIVTTGGLGANPNRFKHCVRRRNMRGVSFRCRSSFERKKQDILTVHPLL